MKRKGIPTDPSFWLLLAVNVYLVWYYFLHPEVFTTLIWIYWCQSVLLGLFTFLDVLTSPRAKKTEPKEPQYGAGILSSKTSAAFFFLVHYGGFHFVYMFFIFTMKRSGPLNFDLFKYAVLAFLAGQLIQFVQRKIQQRKKPGDFGEVLFTPYLRIIPMHLTILLPKFLNVTHMGVFLILKSLADVAMYLIMKPSYSSRESDATLLTTRQ